MGILASLYTGISGLNANGDALGIFSDNLANASTTGFKASRPEFHDMVSKSITGLQGANQVGSGTKVGAVTPIFSQGTLLPTDSVTDLAINGNGFFVFKGIDGESYSRNGTMHFDKEGRLVSNDDCMLMGFLIDEKNGKPNSKLGPISVERTIIDAKPTSKVNMQLNLDLQAPIQTEFLVDKPEETSQFQTTVTAYDSAGTAHVVGMYFNKVEDGQWEWHATIRGEESINGKEGQNVECGTGRLIFDESGKLKDQIINKSSFSFNKGAKGDQFIKFDFGQDLNHGGQGLSVTQYGTDSENYKTFQDGYSTGNITGMSFTEEGVLVGHYTNGENINLAQVALGKFENPVGLLKIGQNRFKKTRESGDVNVGAPNVGGRGKILSRMLEASTTDIATEFINLMQAQRNFQANSKVIMSADEMFQEVLGIKR